MTHFRNTTSSQANDSLASLQETKMPHAEILKLSFQVLIGLFGVIGNVLVVIVISKLGRKRRPADFFIQNLAIADLGTLLFAFPVSIIRLKAQSKWPFGEFGCLYLYPVPEIFYGVSVWCIAVIAVERYRRIMLTVKTPGQNKNRMLLKRAKTVAACVWVTSFLIFCLPMYFVVDYKELSNGGEWCGLNWVSPTLMKGYVVLLTLFSYILPLIVISFSYLAISRTINRSSLFIKAMKRGQQCIVENTQSSILTGVKSVRLEHNKRAKKILTPVVLVFAATMLPLSIYRLTVVFWPAFIDRVPKEFYENTMYVIGVFVALNSSANPIIYSVVSKDFRRHIKTLCHRG